MRSKSQEKAKSSTPSKLVEFVETIVLNKQHPAYKGGKIVVDPENPDNDILLPALVLPVLPDSYQTELSKLCSPVREIPLRSGNNEKIVEGKIDGIPYNPHDFNFPLTSREQRKLGELSELLGHEKTPLRNKKKLGRSLTNFLKSFNRRKEVLKVHLHPKVGKYMHERLAFIRKDAGYQMELQEKIKQKMQTKNLESGGGLRRGRKLVVSEDNEISIKGEKILKL